MYRFSHSRARGSAAVSRPTGKYEQVLLTKNMNEWTKLIKEMKSGRMGAFSLTIIDRSNIADN